MSNQTKTILGAIGAFILVGVGFLVFSSMYSGDTVVTSNAPASSAETLFLNLSTQLDSISFDTTILTDPRFAALSDIHTEILPEATGRNNPFASLGASQ